MASPAQLAANRRNAQKSTGPRSNEGKKQASLNALKSGMTAKTVVLPHESGVDYDEIRVALIEDYAPATSQEPRLDDQVAVRYGRTIRARRFETAMFDNHLRAKKLAHGKDPGPNERDDEGCAVILQVTGAEQLKNYFRYDATISRDYYRAIATLEKMQAARRREEDARDHKAREQEKQQAKTFSAAAGHPDEDADASSEQEPSAPYRETVETKHVPSIGFVLYSGIDSRAAAEMSQSESIRTAKTDVG